MVINSRHAGKSAPNTGKYKHGLTQCNYFVLALLDTFPSILKTRMNVRTQTAVLMASALTQKDLTTVSVHTQWFWTQQKSDASDQQIQVVWSIMHITEVSAPLWGGADMATDPNKFRLGHAWMSLLPLPERILESNAWTIICWSRRHHNIGLHRAWLENSDRRLLEILMRLGLGWAAFSVLIHQLYICLVQPCR